MMKIGTRFALAGTLLLLFMGAAGCERQKSDANEHWIFYVNKENTKIVAAPYEPKEPAVEPKEMIEGMLARLGEDPESLNYRKPLSGAVQLLSWDLDGGHLKLAFSSDYSQMDNVTEILCRAAYVRTLMQAEGVENISFYVGDAPLLDRKGNPVGVMTAESFIENPGEQINSIQTANVTLYFADAEGDALVKENQVCHYSSNISMEKLVMERLLAGPLGTEGRASLPAGTKLVSVSVLEGVCFVNLDSGFLNQNYDIQEGVVIYSIVNSLAELPNINKVQLLVNGDTSLTYRDSYSFGTLYERNLDFLNAQQGPEEESQQEGP